MMLNMTLKMFPLTLALLTLTACRAVHAPIASSGAFAALDAERSTTGTAADATSDWPVRWGDNPAIRGIIIDQDPAIPLRPVHYSRYHQGRSTPGDYQDAAKLAGALGIEEGFKFKPEGPGSFMFVEDTLRDKPVKDPPDLAFRYVSAQAIEQPDADEDHIALQRTWFTFRDPKPGKDTLGTIVLLPGMFGTPEPIVDAAERYWNTKGYAVLRMRSQPSRFTQHLMLTYLDGHTDTIAARAARSADQRIAECAYATHAALDHVFALRESLGQHPVVLVGMSGGAMALPSVYAHRPERFDAAVLIAGGANFLRIMIESNYRDWIDAILIDFDPGSESLGQPTPELIDTLSERYLEFAKLDAYQTAPLLKNIPVLVLHATSDKAVPSGTGDLLYQRLGKPERWTYPLGHELIFAGLPTQIPRINTWLSQQLQSSTEDAAVKPTDSDD